MKPYSKILLALALALALLLLNHSIPFAKEAPTTTAQVPAPLLQKHAKLAKNISNISKTIAQVEATVRSLQNWIDAEPIFRDGSPRLMLLKENELWPDKQPKVIAERLEAENKAKEARGEKVPPPPPVKEESMAKRILTHLQETFLGGKLYPNVIISKGEWDQIEQHMAGYLKTEAQKAIVDNSETLNWSLLHLYEYIHEQMEPQLEHKKYLLNKYTTDLRILKNKLAKLKEKMKQLMRVAQALPITCQCFDFCAGQPNSKARASCYGAMGQKENYCDKLVEKLIEEHIKKMPPAHPDVMNNNSEYYDDYYADIYDIPYEELNLEKVNFLERLMIRFDHSSERAARKTAKEREEILRSNASLDPEEFRQRLMDKYKLEFIEACRQIRQGR